MDREKIRKALDHFENDEFVDAKEIIQREVQGKRDIFLKDRIGLKQEINPAPDGDKSGGIDGENPGGTNGAEDDNQEGDE